MSFRDALRDGVWILLSEQRTSKARLRQELDLSDEANRLPLSTVILMSRCSRSRRIPHRPGRAQEGWSGSLASGKVGKDGSLSLVSRD
jgi:hypothetical protein